MSIKVELIPVVQPRKPKFPCLRRLRDNNELVVLFTGPRWGVALSGVSPERIGVGESWRDCDDPSWELASIKLVSEN